MAAGKVCSQFTRLCKATGIGAAMAFDRYTTQPQQDAAIHIARVHLRPQCLQACHGQCRTDLRHQAGSEGLAHPTRQHAGNAFARLQRHIAGKTVGHHDIDGPL